MGIDPVGIAPGRRQEELQQLHHRVLRPGHRGQRLVVVSRWVRSPAGYSQNLRRCADEPNGSSSLAAYRFNGSGAARRGRRRVITSLSISRHSSPACRQSTPESTNYR